ncbi:MAG: hypothetical protein O7E54_09675, partial [Planctomycetota bacterium]|nr:hypothetical protein [Planctomycetota bacterium]
LWIFLLSMLAACSRGEEATKTAAPLAESAQQEKSQQPASRQPAGRPLAERVPASSVVYIELNGLTGSIEALLDSPMAKEIEAHPLIAHLKQTPQVKSANFYLEVLKDSTGHDLASLARALGSKQIAFSIHPPKPGAKQPTFLLLARVDEEGMRRFLNGIPVMISMAPQPVAPASDTAPAVLAYGPKKGVVFFQDADLLAISSDVALALAARDEPDAALADTPRYTQALEHVPAGRLGFAVIDVKTIRTFAKDPMEAGDFGQALLLGTLPRSAYNAPWAVVTLGLEKQGGVWRLSLAGRVPRAKDTPEPMEKSFGGRLGPLPFRLPQNTVGVIRMRRDFEAVWSNRDDLLPESAIPGLVQFEGIFTTVTGGMSFVEEFLPAFGKEITIVATRATYEEGQAPQVRYPHVALVGRLDKSDELAPRLAIAFQTAIGITNADRAQKGEKTFLVAPVVYKNVTIQSARYLPPSKMEMMGSDGMPARFNVAPSLAVVDDHIVFASALDIVKQIIDGMGKPENRLSGMNAALWINGPELRALGMENRENLIAQAMIKEGKDRAEAENKTDLLLDLSRYAREFTITLDEDDSMQGLTLELVLGAEGE